MEKSTITIGGVDFLVRILDVTSLSGFNSEDYKSAKVASHDLWDAVGVAVMNGDYDACEIDNEILFYAEADFLERDPSDEELLAYLEKNLN